MNGQQAVIEARRARSAPAGIWVLDGDGPEADPVNNYSGKWHAHVRIQASDQPETLDLRFAVGLQVHIASLRSDERGRKLHQAFIDAKAKAVGTSLKTGEVLVHVQH